MGTIALVEETQMVRYNLKHRLFQMSYTVYEFESPTQLLVNQQLLKSIDLIILCSNAGGEESLQELKLVRSNKAVETIPIFFIARSTHLEFIREVAKIGVIDFMVRPFDIDDIVNRVKKHLPILMITYTVEQFVEMEIARAKRGNYPISALLVVMDERQSNSNTSDFLIAFEKIKRNCHTVFRGIDMVLEYGNALLMILPFTAQAGTGVVEKKFIDYVSSFQQDIPSSIRLGTVSFPEESKNSQEFLHMLKSRLHRPAAQ